MLALVESWWNEKGKAEMPPELGVQSRLVTPCSLILWLLREQESKTSLQNLLQDYSMVLLAVSGAEN